MKNIKDIFKVAAIVTTTIGFSSEGKSQDYNIQPICNSTQELIFDVSGIPTDSIGYIKAINKSGSELVLTINPGQQVVVPWTFSGDSLSYTEIYDNFNQTIYTGELDVPTSGPGADNCNILPLNLVSFTGTKDRDNHNVITLITANKINVDRIVLEKSHNNTDRQTIHTFDGEGAYGGKYNYVDPEGTNKTAYYRANTFDKDGRNKLSRVLTVEGKKELINAEIFPNPTAGRCTIDTKDLPQDTDIVIQIANLQGQVIETFNSNTSNDQINVEINGPEGLYIVTIINPSTNESISKKITKQ